MRVKLKPENHLICVSMSSTMLVKDQKRQKFQIQSGVKICEDMSVHNVKKVKGEKVLNGNNPYI